MLMEDSRVVYENVKTTEAGGCFIDKSVRRIRIAHVRLQEHMSIAREGRKSFLRRGTVLPVVDADACSLPGEHDRGCAADPARSTRDKN
jgi:hypothetical protein